MYKKIRGNKKLIISHIADIDGMGSVVLANKFYNRNIDIILGEVADLPVLFEIMDFSGYEVIYCCDLPLSPDTIMVLNRHPEITSKFKHFDHHISYDPANTPDYVNAHAMLNGRKTCGTELFYNYLLTLDNHESIDKDFYREFVEATREQDVWEFKEYGKLAKDLAQVHVLMGSKNYIEFIPTLNDNLNFELPRQIDDILVAQNDVKDLYINNAEKNMLTTSYMGYRIGVTISEQYRSILGNDICERHPEIDFILIINFERMSCSLRTVREDINLGEICKTFEPNGGGHKKAAGFSINRVTMAKLRPIFEEYFESIEKRVDAIKR